MGFKYFVERTNPLSQLSVLKEHLTRPLRMSEPLHFLNDVNHSFWFNERLLFTLHSMSADTVISCPKACSAVTMLTALRQMHTGKHDSAKGLPVDCSF